MTTDLSSETIHASCVARGGVAVLIAGPSGSGKSDLALRLIDRGAILVSDDYTIVTRVNRHLMARAPETIKGKIEIRGIGIVEQPFESDVQVVLIISLSEPSERFPLDQKEQIVVGLALPVIGIRAFEASAPLKVELALSAIRQSSHGQ